LGEGGEIVLVKTTFFLPLKDNDGRDLSAEQENVRKQVFDLFDGWTFLGFYEGVFRMKDGTRSLDRSDAYMALLNPVQPENRSYKQSGVGHSEKGILFVFRTEGA
jgi:hypothetical protein